MQQTNTQRMKLISDQVQSLHTSKGGGVLDPTRLASMAKIAYEDWTEIPNDKIELCCRLARRSKQNPNNFTVLDEWRKMKFGENKPEGKFTPEELKANGYFDPNGAYIRKGTVYTILSLPTCEWDKYPQDIALMEKAAKGGLSEAEKDQWEILLKKKYSIPSREFKGAVTA